MIEKEFVAKLKELPNVIQFFQKEFEKYDFNDSIILQINLVVEEIFVNIVKYAYKDQEIGYCKIMIDYNIEKKEIKIFIEDNGIRFNPLKQEDPDISLSIDEMKVGGLGIFLVKNNMDNIEYKYEDNKNILILTKKIN